MRSVQRTTAFAVFLVLASAGAALSQEQKSACSDPPEAAGFTFWLNYKVGCIIAREVPQDTHVEAATASTGSTALIEKAKAPDVFSLALGLMGAGTKPGEDDRATSMTVSAYALRASINGDNPLNPVVYDKYRQWRHWSFTAGRAEGKDGTPNGRVFGAKWLVVDGRDVAANHEKLQDVSKALTTQGGATTAVLRKATAFIARALEPDKFAAAKTETEAARLEVEFAASELGLANFAKTVASLNEEQLAALDQLLTEDALRINLAQQEINMVIAAMRHAPQLA